MSLIKKCAGMPVPLMPLALGAATLSNAYLAAFGLTWLRHISTVLAIIVWLFVIIRIIAHFSVVKKEYTSNVVLSSLYGVFSMMMMSFGAYILPWFPQLGRGLWLAGTALHATHTLVFTVRNVLRARAWETFVPTWFVTYAGILVSVVNGAEMNAPNLIRVIAYYGMGVYFIILPLMIYRLRTKPLAPGLLHSKCIMVAPVSLAIVSYLNAEPNPSPVVIYLLYAVMLVSFIYVLSQMPAFLAAPFAPGFASITFPNAIAAVASLRMAAYLESVGSLALSRAIWEFAGLQIYFTTALIAFVGYGFLKIFVASYKKQETHA